MSESDGRCPRNPSLLPMDATHACMPHESGQRMHQRQIHPSEKLSKWYLGISRKAGTATRRLVPKQVLSWTQRVSSTSSPSPTTAVLRPDFQAKGIKLKNTTLIRKKKWLAERMKEQQLLRSHMEHRNSGMRDSRFLWLSNGLQSRPPDSLSIFQQKVILSEFSVTRSATCRSNVPARSWSRESIFNPDCVIGVPVAQKEE